MSENPTHTHTIAFRAAAADVTYEHISICRQRCIQILRPYEFVLRGYAFRTLFMLRKGSVWFPSSTLSIHNRNSNKDRQPGLLSAHARYEKDSD